MNKKYLDYEGLEEVASIVNQKLKQVEALPTASVDELGRIYQYIGADTSTLNNGWFYECEVIEGSSPVAYQWVERDVMRNDDTPHVSGTLVEINSKIASNEIEDGSYVALTDDEDAEVKVGVYSTSETKTGEYWINGKPIYRRVFTSQLPLGYQENTSSYYIMIPTGIAAGVIEDFVTQKCMINCAKGTSGEYWFDTTYLTNIHNRVPGTGADVGFTSGYNPTVNFYIRDAGTNIYLANGGGWAENSPVVIILEYTKVAD